MKTFISIISIISIFWILSCKKKTSDPEPAPITTTTTTTGGAPVFTKGVTWSFLGNTTVADSTQCFSSYNQNAIWAGKEGVSLLDFELPNMAVGQYTFGAASTSTLIYNEAAISYTASSGTLNITFCDSTKLSGNFNAVLSSGTASAVMTGTILNIRRNVY